MLGALLHFVVGTVVAFGLSLLFARLAGERSSSAPFGAIVVGIICAALAHFASPWATPAILVLYALVSLHEWRQARRELADYQARQRAEPPAPAAPRSSQNGRSSP